MAISNGNTALLSIEDIIYDKKHNKDLLNENLKNPQNIERIKADGIATSRKIAMMGRRNIWQPEKERFITKKKGK